MDEFSSSEQAKPPSISMGITAHPDDSDFKEDFQYFLTVEGVDCGKEKNVKDFILGFIIPSQSKIVIDISLLSDNTHSKYLINNNTVQVCSKYNYIQYNSCMKWLIMCMM